MFHHGSDNKRHAYAWRIKVHVLVCLALPGAAIGSSWLPRQLKVPAAADEVHTIEMSRALSPVWDALHPTAPAHCRLVKKGMRTPDPEYKEQATMYCRGIRPYIAALDVYTSGQLHRSRSISFLAVACCLLLIAAFAVAAKRQLRKQAAIGAQADTQLLRIRAALEDATDAIAITDEQGQFIYANKVFSDLFKYPPDQISTGSLNAISVDRQAFVDMYRNALSRVPTEGERDLISGKGRKFPALLRCSPILDDTDRIAGILILVSDITERKQAERQLKDLQSQMVQREKLASIGQLAAGVAHEMNTPVGFVASNFKTLESYVGKISKLLLLHDELVRCVEKSEDAGVRDIIVDIRNTSEVLEMDFILKDLQNLFDESAEGLDRVTSIVQNLRDFSRVDQPGGSDEYNINDGIRATLVVARNELKYVAEVETDLGELPCIHCRSGQINQVLLNILINAAQALRLQEKERKGRIAIKTYRDADQIICTISDNGPGISCDTLSKVFDPFFTTKPVGIGTGLGLSVSYDIVVSKHGGELLVDSRVGEGATFTIKLPIGSGKMNSGQETTTDGREEYSIACMGAI